MSKTALPFVACLLALAAVGANAQTLWKWRDASGQLHVSDKAPPAGTPARDIVSSPLPMPAAPPVAATAASPGSPAPTTTLERKKKAADQEKAEKQTAEREAVESKNAAIRKDNCARAQGALANLHSGQRIARVNAKGEREIMDDAALAAEARHAQDVVASSCGPASGPK